MNPQIIDDVKGIPEDDNGVVIDFDSGIEIVSGEGAGEGCEELYDGEPTCTALREKLEEERCGGDRWAFARPVGTNMHEDRYKLVHEDKYRI